MNRSMPSKGVMINTDRIIKAGKRLSCRNGIWQGILAYFQNYEQNILG